MTFTVEVENESGHIVPEVHGIDGARTRRSWDATVWCICGSAYCEWLEEASEHAHAEEDCALCAAGEPLLHSLEPKTGA